MAEESFPVIEKPLSAEQWQSVTLGIGNGILDQGGFPYRLASLSNSANTAVVRASTVTGYSAAILKGFYHKIDADVTIGLPAVTTRTTYHVALQYDPANSEMPVQLRALTSLDRSGGKDYLPLYEVTRDPNQLLADAEVHHVRPRVAPTQVYASEADMPAANTVLWGTIALIHNGRAHGTGVLKMAITGDDAESTNGWFWKTIYDPDGNGFTWNDKSSTSTYDSPVAGGYTRSLGRRGKVRKLRGRIALASGNNFSPGSTYRPWSGTLGASDRPLRATAFTTTVGGSDPVGFARVEVGSDGSVTAWVSKSTAWLSFDGIEWEVP